MKKIHSTVLVFVCLLLSSSIIYLIQLLQFHDPRNTAFYFLQDVAFLPIQVALVTIVLGQILNHREKKERLKKTNLMLSTFFSEVGNELIGQLCQLHGLPCQLEEAITPQEGWTNRDYKLAILQIQQHSFDGNATTDSLGNLKTLLSEKRYLILLMLQNPNLLEHDTFTDLLWAVFHLTDELLCRETLAELPGTDVAHINQDIRRAFQALLLHRMHYMSHLQTDYPYLFSLELRKNPLKKDGSVVIA